MDLKKLSCWVLIFSGWTFVFAQSPSTSLGSQPVPVVLQNSVPGATANPRQGQLPRSVDHRALLPKPGYQDNINSCVGWASAYAARTFYENFYRGWGADAPERSFRLPMFIIKSMVGRTEGHPLSMRSICSKIKGRRP